MEAVAGRPGHAKLLERYGSRIETNPGLGRMLVSFQANRNARFFRWFKYKEAFSAALARDVIGRYSRPGEVVLDPFAGVGTAIFVARSMDRASIGVELLPVGAFAVEARLSARSIRPATFRRHVDAASVIDWAAHDDAEFRLRHIPITRGAFPEPTERGLAGYRAYCRRRLRNPHVRRLFHLACLGVLESVSYTRKDGQYLRWDCRANRPGVRSRFNKGCIARFDDAIREQLREMAADLSAAPDGGHLETGSARMDLRRGSCLDILPQLDDESVDLVLTSPPYCNRYDYTRTYALELVYLGLEAQDVKRLRQAMLSCTVENAAKVDDLRRAYGGRDLEDVFGRVCRMFEGQSALQEVLEILDERGRRRELNNANIPRMIRNYFLEMCFVVFELSRVLRPGGRVVMVNDNVRYAGQEVPVDLILSDFAASFDLHVEHIWTLARGKGNSSQQMGAHGRKELRKGVYVWRKEP
ncbi:MAG: DNA methyltransferase [Planctomycetota bacterium]|jgi:hypothetical protein